MPTINLHNKPFDEATNTKLDIFQRYLEEWLPVFFRQGPKGLMICDFFAGPGYDKKGAPGSPILIFNNIRKYQNNLLEQNVRVRIILNERDPDKFDLLQKTITKEYGNLHAAIRNLVEVYPFQEDFQSLFGRMEDQFKKQPNLFFLDQNGVKEVTKPIFQRLISLYKTDFLFFISSSYIRRFAEEPSFQTIFPDLDPALIKGAPHDQSHRIVLETYKKRIPEDNPALLFPFSIMKNSNIYGLIFCSKHLLGVEKFLRIAWDKDKLSGQANFDIDDVEQQGLFPQYNKIPKKEAFQRKLEKFIVEQRETTNWEILHFTLQEGHIPEHAREKVSNLKKRGKVQYEGNIGFTYKTCSKPEKRHKIKWIDNG
ncbi:three-Cys-motif partner protein [Desulfatibacillum alkenivorans DSM 16219]|uniref:Three-Cys-motif partner protein n=1 Tax=Desulfatibacillum alkenivorans DSM 16219 TaxID=1121393 RepID=A0A1M6Y2J1_9BACT|nr:three-Cys-motif partner protein TcmP [Desulfatibacillum alkenivorans]SHL12329.1 three-Cys-motif partner protein [Desulfatibacillum alkenivorans DSM 16219]